MREVDEVVCWLAGLQLAELERAAAALLADGMSPAQLRQVFDAVVPMMVGQLAQAERDIATAVGRAPVIH